MKKLLIARDHKFAGAIIAATLGLGITYLFNLLTNITFTSEQYLGIHTLLELTTVFISFTVAGIVWFLRDGLDDYQGKFMLLLGINFFTVGILDLFHTLSYEGMPELITPASNHKATLFWLFARFWSAYALLVAFFCKKCLSEEDVCYTAPNSLVVNIVISLLLCTVATVYPGVVPPLLEKGVGLTSLKILLECLLIVLYITALTKVWRLRKNGISENVIENLGYFIIFSIFSEFTFTSYSAVYDATNFIGHLYKAIAYYFLFRAVYCSGVINNLYTLGEMAKMSAELLKQDISLDPIMEIQMNKLRKILPDAERIAVYIAEYDDTYRASYVWGRFSDQMPVGRSCRMNVMTNQFNEKSIILDEPMELLTVFKVEGQTDVPIELPLLLNEAKQVMYIPLVSGNQYFGLIFIYTFSSIRRFGADDLEKAQVFQRFSTLAIAQAKSQEIISKLSFEDSLTELPNRRLFFHELQEIRRAAKINDAPYTVIFVDMNGLKFVNDNLGHAAGDQALKLIGKLLKEECGKLGIAARLGGDEFAIAYRSMGLESAAQTIERLRQTFSAIKLPDYHITFSLAVGGATSPDEADDDETLVNLADDRMYEHKRKLKESGCGICMLKPDE
jgi:diguanylate cyclase (GGDEF)-like protein